MDPALIECFGCTVVVQEGVLRIEKDDSHAKEQRVFFCGYRPTVFKLKLGFLWTIPQH